MSIRNGLLALLADGPKYGYELKKEFEDRTAELWTLNVGQVYTTLGRLLRDELVREEGPQDGSSNAEEQRSYRLTERGHEELSNWFAEARPSAATERDELSIKIAMALSTPGVDVLRVLQTQRTSATASLQQLTRRKAQLEDGDLPQAVVLDAAAGRLEAELRWLDLVEARWLARPTAPRTAPRTTSETRRTRR